MRPGSRSLPTTSPSAPHAADEAVILNFPGNPTGGVVERKLNAEISRILAAHTC
jgi:aspartate/methionine/tyrosine aminotransferase